MTNDLVTNVKITLSEALLGFSRVIVTHLDGRGIKVSSPPGKIIKPSDSIIIRGEGMPVEKRPDTKGDLHVVFTVEMPDADWLKTVDTAVSFLSYNLGGPTNHRFQGSHQASTTKETGDGPSSLNRRRR